MHTDVQHQRTSQHGSHLCLAGSETEGDGTVPSSYRAEGKQVQGHYDKYFIVENLKGSQGHTSFFQVTRDTLHSAIITGSVQLHSIHFKDRLQTSDLRLIDTQGWSVTCAGSL